MARRRSGQRLAAALLATALISTACAGGGASGDGDGGGAPTVRFSGLPDPAPLPVLVMQELGIDERHGFDAEFLEVDADAATNSFLLGESDIAVDQDATSSAIANNEGHGVVSFYPALNNTASIVVPENSPIRTPKDLAGRRVGHFGTDSGTTQSVAVSLRTGHGIDPLTDYELVQSSPAALPELLASGEVDAIFDYQPYGLRAVANVPGRYLFEVTPHWQKATGWSPPLAMLTAQRDWLDKNPELATRVQAAWKEATQVIVDSGYALFLEDPYADFLGLEPEELQRLADYCRGLPCYAGEWTQRDVDQQMEYLRLLVEQGALDRLPAQPPVAVLGQRAAG